MTTRHAPQTRHRRASPAPHAPASPTRALPWATFLAAVIGIGLPEATAEIVGSHAVNGNGTVTYTYTVDNTTGQDAVAAWSLEFPFATPDWNQADTGIGGDVQTPDPDWIAQAGTPTSGLSAQDFVSLLIDLDVPAGSMFGTFSFTSSYLPGTVTFFEFYAGGDFNSGSVVGPAFAPPDAVPEASTWIAAGGLLAVAALRLHRRRTT